MWSDGFVGPFHTTAAFVNILFTASVRLPSHCSCSRPTEELEVFSKCTDEEPNFRFSYVQMIYCHDILAPHCRAQLSIHFEFSVVAIMQL